MAFRAQLNDLIEKGDGLVFTREVDAERVPRQYLTLLVKEDKLERVSRGVYATPDTFVMKCSKFHWTSITSSF